MKQKTFTESIFNTILPSQVIATLSGFLAMVVDGIVVGRFLGVTAVSACGLIAPLMMLLVALAQMIYHGNQMLCSTEVGKGDIREANRVFSAALMTLVGIAAVSSVLIILFRTPVAIALGAPAGSELLTLTGEYLLGYIIGAPGFMCVLLLPGILQLDGDRETAIRAVLVLMVSDIVLDLANVFMFHGGLFGMGLASSVSNYLALLLMALHFFKKNAMFRFTPTDAAWQRMGDVVKRGMPQTVYAICRTFMTLFLNRILLHYGSELYVAAYSIISTIGNCIMSVGSGIGTIALMVTGVANGEEDRETLKDVVRAVWKLSLVYNIAIIVVVELFAPFFVNLFLKGNVDARDIAVWGLRLYTLFLVFYSLNSGFREYIQGLGLLVTANAQNVLENVFVTGMALILAKGVGIDSVWLCFLFGHILTFGYFIITTFIKKKKVAFTAENFHLVPEGYGIPEEDSLELSVASIDEAVGLSEKAAAFCKEKGADARLSLLLPLCVEEMAVNVVKHGFADGKKHFLNVRVLFKKGGWIIRMRDDCRLFSPKEYEKIHHGDEPEANIGIRMVYKMVKDIQYFNTLKLNNILIRI